jgi:abelson tyrosine-protein kinase 1
VSELFENLRLKAGRKPGTSAVESDQQQQKDSELMAPPPSSSAKPLQSATRSGSGSKQVDLKSDSSVQEATFDFKSRLRKVEKTENPATAETSTTTTASTVSSPPKTNKLGDKTVDDFDDKRKSSGSINSLKRMWEKEREQQQLGQQRISAKGYNDGLPSTKPPPPPVQPTPDKPVIPVKPSTVKPLKNSSAAIYATPTASVPNSAKPPVANRSSVYAKSSCPSAPLVIPAADDIGGGGSERQKIVALCSEAEQILSQSHSTPTQWMGLLANVHSLCHTYADCVAPHGRFHFRQLIAKLETQTKEMKQTSVIGPLRNSSEHSRLVGDVKNTVRDLANALQR